MFWGRIIFLSGPQRWSNHRRLWASIPRLRFIGASIGGVSRCDYIPRIDAVFRILYFPASRLCGSFTFARFITANPGHQRLTGRKRIGPDRLAYLWHVGHAVATVRRRTAGKSVAKVPPRQNTPFTLAGPICWLAMSVKSWMAGESEEAEEIGAVTSRTRLSP